MIKNKFKQIARYSYWGTFLFLFVFTNESKAQEKLTLSKAIEFALQNKSDAQKAQLDIENSNYQIVEARSNVLPKLNVGGTITYNPKLQQMALDFNGQTQVLKMGTEWQSNGAIQFEQAIFNLAAFNGLKAAKTTREFYQLNANLTEEQIIETVANSFFDFYKVKSQIKTIERTIDNNSKLRTVLESLEKEGLAKGIDIDRINVALSNLNSSKIQLENALKLQENALKYLIGMDISQEIELSSDDFEETSFDMNYNDLNNSTRTEVKMMEKQLELLKYSKSTIKYSMFPTLGLSANYGYISMGDRFPYFAGADQGVYGSDFAGINLNLNVPIFNGAAIRSKMQQTDVEIRKLQADLNDIKLGLSLQNINAQVQIKNSLLTIESQKSNVELAERVLDNIRNNYQNGLVSLTELIDAENAYIEAQNNYTAAIVDYKIAEIQLIKAKGELKSYYK